MKNLVVYYSRDGNTETIAKEISKAVNGELKKIELINDINYVWAGFAGSLGLIGKIKEIDFNVNDYDNIFIGTPVWGGKSSTPINAFINKTNFKGKNVFVFVTQYDKHHPYKVYDCMTKRVRAKGGNVIYYLFIPSNKKNILTSVQINRTVVNWANKIRPFLKG